jgi:ABC-type antimicrobial peptide transport system permease subunit
VAVVNEAFVRRWYPRGDAMGRAVRQPAGKGVPERSYEVVGVVGDARIQDYLAEPEPVVYLSNGQRSYASGAALTVATNIDPVVAAPRLRQWLRDYESHIAIVNVLPYSEVVRGFTYGQRMNAQMFSALAVLGLLLSVVGVFAVMSLAVSRRTREIGIRMAVGARPGDVGRLVMARALVPVIMGLAAGGLISLLMSRLLRSLLLGVEPTDPWTLVGASAVFVVASLVAAAVPVRRAVAVDPARSLRAD